MKNRLRDPLRVQETVHVTGFWGLAERLRERPKTFRGTRGAESRK